MAAWPSSSPSTGTLTGTAGVPIVPYVVGFATPSAPGESITYTTSGLPTGLRLDQGILTGIPAAAGTGAITITATEGSTSVPRSVPYSISAFSAVAIVSSDAARSWVRHQSVDETYVVPAASGTGPIRYTASGVPAGVSFDGTTRRFHGEPTATGSGTITITATNERSTDSLSLGYTVTANPPVVLAAIAAPPDWEVGETVSLNIPAATGGAGPITYTATGVPDGLTFFAESRWLYGEPTSAGSGTITFTATDGHTTQELTMAYSVETATAPAPLVFEQGSRMLNFKHRMEVPSEFQLPGATGGTGAITYTATGLPTGVVFAGATRRLYGTSADPGPSTGTIEMTATDEAGATATTTVNYTLGAAVAPPVFPDGPVDTSSWRYMEPVRYDFLPLATSSANLRYSATGLPDGLEIFDGADSNEPWLLGVIQSQGSGTIELTATDNFGQTATKSIPYNIPTAPLQLITSAMPRRAHQTWTIGTAITALPSEFESSEPVTYTATGLPPGLSIDAATGAITGMPTGIPDALTEGFVRLELLVGSTYQHLHHGSVLEIMRMSGFVIVGGGVFTPPDGWFRSSMVTPGFFEFSLDSGGQVRLVTRLGTESDPHLSQNMHEDMFLQLRIGTAANPDVLAFGGPGWAGSEQTQVNSWWTPSNHVEIPPIVRRYSARPAYAELLIFSSIEAAGVRADAYDSSWPAARFEGIAVVVAESGNRRTEQVIPYWIEV